MKRTIALILAVMLVLAALPATALAASYSKTIVYRTITTANLRKGPGTGYDKKGNALVTGTAFTVTKKSGNWYKIKTLKTGRVGWVSKNLTRQYAYAKVTTKKNGLNVRSGPGADYSLKGSIPKGSKNVLVKYISDGWAYVKKGRLEGWSCIKGGYSYPLLTWNA